MSNQPAVVVDKSKNKTAKCSSAKKRKWNPSKSKELWLIIVLLLSTIFEVVASQSKMDLQFTAIDSKDATAALSNKHLDSASTIITKASKSNLKTKANKISTSTSKSGKESKRSRSTSARSSSTSTTTATSSASSGTTTTATTLATTSSATTTNTSTTTATPPTSSTTSATTIATPTAATPSSSTTSNITPATTAATPSSSTTSITTLATTTATPPTDSCMLGDATLLQEELSSTAESFNMCGENIETLKEKVEAFAETIDDVDTLFGTIDNVNEIIDTLEDTAQAVSIFTDRIPKVGTMIKLVRKTVDKFQKKIERAIDPVTDKLEDVKSVLSNVTSILEEANSFTTSAAEGIESIRSPLSTAIACSQRFQCALDEEINFLAEQVPLQPLTVAQDALGICSDVFDALFAINIDLDFPDIGIIEEFTDFLNNIVNWINKFVEDVTGKDFG